MKTASKICLFVNHGLASCKITQAILKDGTEISNIELIQTFKLVKSLKESLLKKRP